jgi:hypothetical protein
MKTYKLKDSITDEMLHLICVDFTDTVRNLTFHVGRRKDAPEDGDVFGGLICDLVSEDGEWVIPMSYAEEIIEAKDQKTSDRTLEVISKDLADAMSKVRTLELEFEEYVKEQGRKNGIDIEIEIAGYNS